MRRIVLQLICIVSGILFGTFSIFTVYCVGLIFGSMDRAASVSIIGGADAPTMEFLLHEVAGSPIFYAAIVTLLLFLGTGLALIFCKAPEK